MLRDKDLFIWEATNSYGRVNLVLSHLLFETLNTFNRWVPVLLLQRDGITFKSKISFQRRPQPQGGTPSPPHNPWPRPWVLFIPQPHNEHSATELDYHPAVSTRATSFLPNTPVETEESYSAELGTIFVSGVLMYLVGSRRQPQIELACFPHSNCTDTSPPPHKGMHPLCKRTGRTPFLTRYLILW